MPIFEYKAVNLDCIKTTGKMEANNRELVVSALREKNYFPIRIVELHYERDFKINKFCKLSLKTLAIFCRQLGVVLSSGIGVLRGLEIIKHQAVSKRQKKIISMVIEEVQKGRSLSEGMAAHNIFPKLLVNMVRSGEISGKLDTIMNRMALYYEKEYKLKEKVKGAMTYPAVVCTFAILVIIVLVTKVLPNFINMIIQGGGNIENLPLPTKIVMTMNNITKHYGLVLLILIFFIFIAVSYIFKTKGGKSVKDKVKLSLPIIGNIYSQIQVGRFSRTLGMLINGGVNIVECIRICSLVVDNQVFSKVLETSLESIKKGNRISDTLETSKRFPKLLLQMIKIGEETGTLDEVLEKTAEYYDCEVEALSAKLVTLIEPFIIIILATFVGFIILAVIMPIYEIYNTIGG